MSDDVRERRLRRAAQRQGLRLIKSRRRDPRALDYDKWAIADINTGTIIAGEFKININEVEEYLTK